MVSGETSFEEAFPRFPLKQIEAISPFPLALFTPGEAEGARDINAVRFPLLFWESPSFFTFCIMIDVLDVFFLLLISRC